MLKSNKIKFKFYGKSDETNIAEIVLNCNTNHELPVNVMDRIEEFINNQFKNDYITNDKFQELKEQQKFAEQAKKQNEKYQKNLLKQEALKKKECKPVKNKYDL